MSAPTSPGSHEKLALDGDHLNVPLQGGGSISPSASLSQDDLHQTVQTVVQRNSLSPVSRSQSPSASRTVAHGTYLISVRKETFLIAIRCRLLQYMMQHVDVPLPLLCLDIDQYFARLPSLLTPLSEPLHGYQIHVVEQWLTDRHRPIDTVISYTGDSDHVVHLLQLEMTKQPRSNTDLDQGLYYVLNQVLFTYMNQEKARPMPTPVGIVLVSNLGSVPAQWNLLHLPEGDFDNISRILRLNINLRRLGCSGRSALTLRPPTDAQLEKCLQLFRLFPPVHATGFEQSVSELVRLLQTCLIAFGCGLNRWICDGLLCDETRQALAYCRQRFPLLQNEVNASSEQPPCKLSEVLILTSKLVTYRYRLAQIGYPLSKDVFTHMDALLSAILQFQRTFRVPTTGVLDEATVRAIDLQTVSQSNNTSSSQPTSNKLPKMFKKLDEASRIDVETNDLDVFLKTVATDRIKALWKGNKYLPVQQRTDATPAATEQMLDGHLAEGLIQGGKEIGKSILRGVSTGSNKFNEAMKDSGRAVKGGISKLSKEVEGLVVRHSRQPSQTKILTVPASGSGTPQSFASPLLSQESGGESSLPTSGKPPRYKKVPMQMVAESSANGSASDLSLIASAVPDRTPTMEWVASPSPVSTEYPVRARALSVDSASWKRDHFIGESAFVLTRTVSESDLLLRLRALEEEDLHEELEDPETVLFMESQLLEMQLQHRQIKQRMTSMQQVTNDITSLVQQLQGRYEIKLREYKSMERSVNELLHQQAAAAESVEQQQAEAAKLQYDVQALEEQLRENTESLQHLDTLIHGMQQQLPESRDLTTTPSQSIFTWIQSFMKR